MFECKEVQRMEKNYLIENIKILLNNCDDIELLYLIQSLLNAEN